MNIRSVVVRLSPRFLLFCGFILLVIVPISGLSCSPGGAPTPSAPTTSPASSSPATAVPYSVAVILSDKQIAALTVSDLSKLTQVKANVAGADEQGPTLLSVLDFAGIKDFREVTIYGFTKGRVASAQLTLKNTEVTVNMILALVSRGTVKLTGTDIGADKAIIDVSRLVVK